LDKRRRKKEKLKITFFNSDGIGKYDLKIDYITEMIRKHHITIILETRSDKAIKRILPHVPGIHYYHNNIDNQGRKGQGIGVFIHSTLKDHISIWKPATENFIWLKTNKEIWGTQKDVILGAIYIPPYNSQMENRERNIVDTYNKIGNYISEALESNLLVLLGGDFNAKLGTQSEFTEEHNILIDKFPELGKDRNMHSSKKTNTSGELLLDTATTSGPMICTTGRGRGDVGQPTCRNKTRTEHILLHEELYATKYNIHTGKMNSGSDHSPLHITFHTKSKITRDIEGLHGAGHICNDQCKKKEMEESILNWKDQNQKQYGDTVAANIQANQNIINQAIEDKNPSKIADILADIILTSAREAKMTRPWTCAFKKQAGIKHPNWFNDDCKISKKGLKEALKQDTSHAYQHQKKNTKNF